MAFPWFKQQNASVQPENTFSQHILIVDDDIALLDMFQHMLATPGTEVITLASSLDVPTAIADKSIDLIFLDINMPGKDGFAVLKELKGNPVTASIPVIMLTNVGEIDSINRGIELGAVDYTIKANTSPEKIRNLVAKHIVAFKSNS